MSSSVECAAWHAAAGVGRELPVQCEVSFEREVSRVAALAEAVVLDRDEHGGREAVVELRDVDVGGFETGHPVRGLR
ncbi:MAG: hypothetical protein E6G04_01705 [Actinobacteria bacterium]|nr:MAG: hypothetical protein E6G04_01705 [Actinomycetota bacterium]